MGKFLTRTKPAESSAGKKRPATATGKINAGKKAKPSAPSGVAAKSASWAKVRSIPVPAAEYQDQTLLFTTLKDGRELLIGDEVWVLPPGASAASPAGLKGSLQPVGKMAGDRFAALPGLDAAAVVIGNGFGATPQRLTLCSLPTTEMVADVPLPGISADRNYGGGGFINSIHAAAVPDDAGAVCLLVCTEHRLFAFTVRETGGPERLKCVLETRSRSRATARPGS